MARRRPTTLADSKWHPVPLKRDGCLIPNLIGTYFCGAKNGKKTCYRIFDCREMGVESPRSDNNMNDSCVKIYLYLEGRECEISFILAYFLFHPRPRKFRNVPCFECKLRTMSYYGASRDFWKQSCSWMEV